MGNVSRWEYTQDPNETIAELGGTMVDFVGRWVEFFFTVPKHHHPKLTHHSTSKFSDDLDKDQLQYQNSLDQKDVKVWVLLDSNLDGFYTTLLPVDQKWAIIFTTYITMASQAEFPGLNETELKDLVNKDTGAASTLEASINSEVLRPVKVEGSTIIKLKGDNILGLPPSDNVKVFFSAYANLLKPMSPGEYLIISKGLSPNYINDVKYSVSVRKKL
jgi:hypothetical protein